MPLKDKFNHKKLGFTVNMSRNWTIGHIFIKKGKKKDEGDRHT